MNTPPDESLLGHYFLENPWPLGLFSLAVTLILALIWYQQGNGRIAIASGVALIITGAIFLLEAVVVTPAEHATVLIRSVVDSAEAGEPDAILETIAPNASLHLESLQQPGRPFSDLEGSIRSLERANRISDNWVTGLRGWTLDSNRAIVHLACLTTTESSYGSVPNTWVFEVRRSPDGAWRIQRIVFESLMGRTPDRPLR